MAKATVLFAFLLSLLVGAIAMNANPETGPEGDYEPFDPENVWEIIPGDDPIINTFPAEYQPHYYWFEMPNTPQVTVNFVSLNYSNGAGSCDTDLEWIINAPLVRWGGYDDYETWGCWDGPSEDNMCWYYSNWDSFYDSYDYSIGVDSDMYGHPGQMVYITLREDSPSYECSYSIQVTIDYDECSSDEIATYGSNGEDCETFAEIMEDGDYVSGTLNSDQYKIFMVDVPENTARMWVSVESEVADGWYLGAYIGSASTDVGWINAYNQTGTTYWTFDQSAGTAWGEIYWTLYSYYDNADYKITFHWETCDDGYTGWGANENPPDDSNPGDCKDEYADDVELNDFPKSVTIKNVYKRNPDNYYSGTQFDIPVPWGSYGWVNVTCTTSDGSGSDSFVIVQTGGNTPDCDDDYTSYMDCNNDGSEYYKLILSQTLYAGPDLQFVMCTSSETPIDFTVNLDADITLGHMGSASAVQVGLLALVLAFALLF